MFLLTPLMELINLKNIKMIKTEPVSYNTDLAYNYTKFLVYLDDGQITTLRTIMTKKNINNVLQHDDDCNNYFELIVEKLAQYNLIIELDT